MDAFFRGRDQRLRSVSLALGCTAARRAVARKCAAAGSRRGWLRGASGERGGHPPPARQDPRPVPGDLERPSAPQRPPTRAPRPSAAAAMRLRVRLQKQTRRLEVLAAEPTLGQLRAHLRRALPDWGFRWAAGPWRGPGVSSGPGKLSPGAESAPRPPRRVLGRVGADGSGSLGFSRRDVAFLPRWS